VKRRQRQRGGSDKKHIERTKDGEKLSAGHRGRSRKERERNSRDGKETRSLGCLTRSRKVNAILMLNPVNLRAHV
jgi:hypothetical protein